MFNSLAWTASSSPPQLGVMPGPLPILVSFYRWALLMCLRSSTAPDKFWPLRVQKSLYPGPRAPIDAIKTPLETQELNRYLSLKSSRQVTPSSCSPALHWNPEADPLYTRCSRQWGSWSAFPGQPEDEPQWAPNICVPASNSHTIGLFFSHPKHKFVLVSHHLRLTDRALRSHWAPGPEASQTEAIINTCPGRPWLQWASFLLRL